MWISENKGHEYKSMTIKDVEGDKRQNKRGK
jgi:hypothetical protein